MMLSKIVSEPTKKQFNAPRHTELANITAANYVEEIKEEDLYVLIDRFGYTKSVDASSYSRIAPDTLEEYHHIVPLRNIDKLCVFTKGGYMHQVKAMNIPKGRAKDKGVLIQNLCKLEMMSLSFILVLKNCLIHSFYSLREPALSNWYPVSSLKQIVRQSPQQNWQKVMNLYAYSR